MKQMYSQLIDATCHQLFAIMCTQLHNVARNLHAVRRIVLPLLEPDLTISYETIKAFEYSNHAARERSKL